MPLAFVLGLIVLVVALLAISHARRGAGANLGLLVQRAAIGLGAILILGLTLTGRLHWLVTLFGVGVPLLLRAFAASRLVKAAKGPTPGRSSDVETRFLRMSLDHDSGAMQGEVREGAHRGRRLDDLTFDELVELLRNYHRVDEESAKLLETYLDRTHGDGWRDDVGETDGRPHGSHGGDTMTPDEALEILGLEGEPSEEEIVDAHRRLMQKIHPDRGGSDYLASQVNRAKDLLLDHK